MLHIQKVVRPSSVEEAFETLTKNKNNCVLGGMIWLKMEDRTIPTGVDLSLLGLDKIVETEDGFEIGAMVTLRQLETHVSFNQATSYAFQEAVKDIVGVQLRNLATVGGSLYSRFGFSDVYTVLMALEAKVHFHSAGWITLEELSKRPYEKDILTHVFVPKPAGRAVFMCVRRSATDLSVLNVAVLDKGDYYKICVGARPAIAISYDVEKDDIDTVADKIQSQTIVGSNMRGSKEYRHQLVNVLVKRALRKVEKDHACTN